MKEGMKVLKDHGIRVTSQRLAVYTLLDQERSHLTAEEIYERVRSNYPAFSLATVYTILTLFRQKGLADEIRIQFDKSRFDIHTNAHHHFSCRVCNRIYDLDVPLCSALQQKKTQGHRIEEFQGYFYGVCKACQKKG